MLFLAIFLNTISSFLIGSVYNSVLIVFISFFAFCVLNFEILSLFNSISKGWVLFLEIIFLIFSIFLFKVKKATFLKPKLDFKKIKNCFKLDNSLFILFLAFLSLTIITFILGYFMPPLEPDSQTYHFFRVIKFIENHSLNHFETNDIRALIMPINSEILYGFIYLFKKNLNGFGLVSYFSFFLCIFSFWDIFEKFKFSFRKRLYAIFIFSSFANIIIELPSLQTDVLVGSLLISAFSLFLKDKKEYVYFSSLALSLAFGVKSTGIIAFLGFLITIILYEILIEKNKKLQKTKLFLGFLSLNFLIFSSYNYILNFLQFQNLLSNKAAYLGHCFWGGLEGYLSNLINFFFQSFDFTGFLWGFYLNSKILFLKQEVFNFLNINPLIGCNIKQQILNITTDEQIAGFGILGFLVFLPQVFISVFKIFINKNKKTILCFILGLCFLINILTLAFSTGYMIYSIRFVISFVCLSSIILINVYHKKFFLKYFIFFFCLFYMAILPIFIKRMPFKIILSDLKNNGFNSEIFIEDCFKGKIIPVLEIAKNVDKTIKTRFFDCKKIAFIKTSASSLLFLKEQEKKGFYKIDFLNPALITKEKLENYDLIILENEKQDDNTFNSKKVKINYHFKNNELIFEDNKNVNCYYKDILSNITLNPNTATERVCFTYDYLVKVNNFKPNFSETIELKNLENNSTIYYFKKDSL